MQSGPSLLSTTTRRVKANILPLRPIQMRIHNRRCAIQHALHSQRKKSLEILGGARVLRPDPPARGRLCDAGVVWRRRETDVEFLVGCLACVAVGVHEECGFPRRVPALELMRGWFALVYRRGEHANGAQMGF